MKSFATLVLIAVVMFICNACNVKSQPNKHNELSKETIVKNKIREVKVVENGKLRKLDVFNQSGNPIKNGVYDIEGNIVKMTVWKYDRLGNVVEILQSQIQENYDFLTKYYKDNNNLNVTERVRFLKPDSLSIEIDISRRDSKKRLVKEEKYISNNKSLPLSGKKEIYRVEYIYHSNDSLKSKKIYSNGLKELLLYNNMGRLIDEYNYDDEGKVIVHLTNKYWNNVLILIESYVNHEENNSFEKEYKYNKDKKLVEVFYKDKDMDVKEKIYHAIYKNDKLIEESTFNTSGNPIDRKTYEYVESIVKVSLYTINPSNNSLFKESITELNIFSKKIFKVIAYNVDGTFSFGKGWRYDNRGNLIEEMVYVSPESKGIRSKIWEYNSVDSLIHLATYSNEKLLMEDWNLYEGKNLIETRHCIYRKDTLCEKYLYKFDSVGNKISESFIQKNRRVFEIIYSYDNLGNIIEMMKKQDEILIYKFVYLYNEKGLLIEERKMDKDQNSINLLIIEYTYF